jgi:ABC-2 type transport system ATP-binding protein
LLKTRKEVEITDFELINNKSLNGIFEYTIKKTVGDTNNSLLSKLMAQTEILSFEEILPSMNDIFIKTVSQ